MEGATEPVACCSVILVEGASDRCAIEGIAARRGVDLAAEGIAVVVMGGAHAVARFVHRFGPRGLDLRLSGMYDVGEQDTLLRGLRHGGLGSRLNRSDLESSGFFACVTDLEDELIRAVGTDDVVRILREQRDLDSFRRFQNQPAQRDRPIDAQLRRFMGTRSGRKLDYARLLVEAVDLSRPPRPLDLVLSAARGSPASPSSARGRR